MLQSVAAASAWVAVTGAAPGGYRILDAHAHVWTHSREFPFAPGAKIPDAEATPEMLIDAMKLHGVEKTVLIQVTYYGYDNSLLAAALKQYPQYFKGVCWVDPEDPASPDRLERLTVEQGF